MSACSSITLAAKTIADISVDINMLGTTVIQSLFTTDIVDGSDDSVCMTRCSLIQETESLRPKKCADDSRDAPSDSEYFCKCLWNDAYVFYGKSVDVNGSWLLDTTKGWDYIDSTSNGDRNCF